MSVADLLTERAGQEHLPVERLLRRHLLHGVLRRWSLSGQADAMLLRGGLLMQLWVGPHRRDTRDIDFLGLFARDMDDTTRRLHQILALPVDDELSFSLDTLHSSIIWQETDFPGHRFMLQGRAIGQEMELQIDVGFGDPIVPPAQWIDYPCLVGAPARIFAVRPELLTAWKLHGLFEHGARRWQPKDLCDLHLLVTHVSLDEGLLVEGIRTAFAARSAPLEQVLEVVYSRPWWQKESNRAKWARFCAASVVPVPPDVEEVAAVVARALRPALRQLIAFPTEGTWPDEAGRGG